MLHCPVSTYFEANNGHGNHTPGMTGLAADIGNHQNFHIKTCKCYYLQLNGMMIDFKQA